MKVKKFDHEFLEAYYKMFFFFLENGKTDKRME
jgi:hypothetical protein